MNLSILIQFLIYFLTIFLKLLYWSIFIWVLMSWFASSKSRLGDLLEQIVRPILRPFRWARIGMFDLSPIAALLTINFVANNLFRFLTKFL
ncbi:YggT family protein [Candidatus Gracilibacteria bacterium]|nr:YggT family protein [Candidatus Gracilibacteria bacterium]